MRAESSYEQVIQRLGELGDGRLPDVAVALCKLEVTRDGRVRFHGGDVGVTPQARASLADELGMSAEAIPSDGDHRQVALINARLRRSDKTVRLHLVREGNEPVIRALHSSLRTSGNERVLIPLVTGLREALDLSFTRCERGARETVVVARTAISFHAHGVRFRHGFAVVLDERAVVVCHAALFVDDERIALAQVAAMPADDTTSAAGSLRGTLTSAFATAERHVTAALAEDMPRARQVADLFLDCPLIATDLVATVTRRLAELDAPTRFDVVDTMTRGLDHVEADVRIAVEQRAGEVLALED